MRLIDADELSKTIKETCLLAKPWDYVLIEQTIADAPTIEPERKKGEWEERKVSSEKVIDEWQSARCSVCGKYHTTPYLYYFDNFNFCPNCGARMEI